MKTAMTRRNFATTRTSQRGDWVGRGERIRTSDSCVPNAVLYQAELHPDGEFQYLRVTAKAANSSKLSLYFESGSMAIALRASPAETSACARV